MGQKASSQVCVTGQRRLGTDIAAASARCLVNRGQLGFFESSWANSPHSVCSSGALSLPLERIHTCAKAPAPLVNLTCQPDTSVCGLGVILKRDIAGTSTPTAAARGVCAQTKTASALTPSLTSVTSVLCGLLAAALTRCPTLTHLCCYPLSPWSATYTGKPLFGTLIALLHNGQPVLGVIDQPITRERWVGVAGAASTLNGRPIATRSCGDIGNAYMYATTPHMFAGATEQVRLTRGGMCVEEAQGRPVQQRQTQLAGGVVTR